MVRRAATEPFKDVEVDEDNLSQSLDYWVGFKGAACAAFIIWQHRKAFVREGMADYRIQRTAKTPGWFRVGIEALQRSPNWTVVVMSGGAFGPFRVYRVKWKKHKAGKPS